VVFLLCLFNSSVVSSNKRQVSDVETGRDQVSYRAVNLVLPKSQSFDAEPGED
jgi:hypothetical protein